ncbi:hypothetical protein Tco_0791685 [Tanacetum coccineum]
MGKQSNKGAALLQCSHPDRLCPAPPDTSVSGMPWLQSVAISLLVPCSFPTWGHSPSPEWLGAPHSKANYGPLAAPTVRVSVPKLPAVSAVWYTRP